MFLLDLHGKRILCSLCASRAQPRIFSWGGGGAKQAVSDSRGPDGMLPQEMLENLGINVYL